MRKFHMAALAAAFILTPALSYAADAAAPAAPAAAAPLPYGAPITLDQAKAAMAAAEAEAKKNNWAMVIHILDSGGNTVMVHRLDNTQLGSLRVAAGKARTALEFRRPSKAFQDGLAAGSPMQTLTLPDVVMVQGAVPIVLGGKIIGSIGASGGTSPQDEQVSMAGAAAVK